MNKSDHEKITRFTIDSFEDLFTSEFRKLLGEKGSLISQGSKKEDEGGLVRILNWHFYRAEDSPYLKPFPFMVLGTTHPSSRKIFTEHAAALLNKTNNNDIEAIFLLAGRIIHHIQDMSTPAHVVPVYHGPTLYPKYFPSKKDAFEEFSKKHIDNYLSTSEISMTFEENDRIIKESNSTILSLYDQVAKRTLSYLKSDESSFKVKVNGIKEKGTCDLFWIKFDPIKPRHNKTDGWGEYGLFGEVSKDKKYFGASSCIKKYNGDTYTIDFKDYEHIYIHFIKQMVLDTLTVLCYVEKHILKLS